MKRDAGSFSPDDSQPDKTEAKEAGPYKAGMNKLEWPKWERFVGDFAELAAAVRGKGQLTATPEEDVAVQETLQLASGME